MTASNLATGLADDGDAAVENTECTKRSRWTGEELEGKTRFTSSAAACEAASEKRGALFEEGFEG